MSVNESAAERGAEGAPIIPESGLAPIVTSPASPDAPLPVISYGPRGITVRPVVEGSGRGHVVFRISGRALPITSRSFDGTIVVSGHEGVDESTLTWIRHIHARVARAVNHLAPETRIAVNGDSATSQSVVRYALHQIDLDDVERSVGPIGYGLVEVPPTLQADIRRYLTAGLRATRRGGLSKQVWSIKRQAVVRASAPGETMRMYGEGRWRSDTDHATVRAVIIGSEPVRENEELVELRESLVERLDEALFAARRYRSPFGHRSHTLSVDHWQPSVLDIN